MNCTVLNFRIKVIIIFKKGVFKGKNWVLKILNHCWDLELIPSECELAKVVTIYKKGDTEGLVNYALSISKVNMATLIIETKERIKFSFRSVGGFSVNKFARDYFNGGGHKNAAGGSLEVKLSLALDKFLDKIDEYQKELNYLI